MPADWPHPAGPARGAGWNVPAPAVLWPSAPSPLPVSAGRAIWVSAECQPAPPPPARCQCRWEGASGPVPACTPPAWPPSDLGQDLYSCTGPPLSAPAPICRRSAPCRRPASSPAVSEDPSADPGTPPRRVIELNGRTAPSLWRAPRHGGAPPHTEGHLGPRGESSAATSDREVSPQLPPRTER